MAWLNGDAAAGVTYRGYLGATGQDSQAWLAQERWQEMEALVRVAARAGRLGAWSLRLSDMAWAWSDEVRAIHEVGPEFRPTTETALAFYEPRSQLRIMSAFEDCATCGTPFDLELELETAGGRRAWIRAIGEAERDADGGITALRGAIQDITRHRAAVAEAHKTGERLARTLENLPDGYILLDRQWRFVYLNPEAERILHRTRAELLGKSMLRTFPETGRGVFLEKCTDAATANRSVEFTKFYAPLAIWVHFKVTPTDEGLTFCIRDDTERIAMRREVLRLRAQLGRKTAPD
ncbi:PAS domain-containing protein [Ramlibacter sp. PS4R-6]|uniref:PAS domain-containing protein n=1 Tax=Ramlibacter sp. PS4R-6 TaxID=3133438 RepID=UPI0030A531EB